jgi:N-acetylated-alpha-linked acidic dipeptidase
MGMLIYRIGESPSIRLNLLEYANDLNLSVEALVKQYKDNPEAPDFTALTAAANDLVKAAEKFENAPETEQNRKLRNGIRLRFERALTDKAGLPGRPWFRHVVYAPGVYLGYGAEVFSGIQHSINQKDGETAKVAATQAANALKRAANLLK